MLCEGSFHEIIELLLFICIDRRLICLDFLFVFIMLVILLVEVVPGDRLLYAHAHWKDVLNAQLLGQWMRSRDDFHGRPHLALIFADGKKLVFILFLDKLIIQLELSLFFVLFL